MNAMARLVVSLSMLRMALGLVCASAGVPVDAQGQQLEAKSTTATAIPGVVAEGAPVELIHDGLAGTDGITTMPDGSLVFIEQNSPRILKLNPADDTLSTLVPDAERARALGIDSNGRLVTLFTQGRQGRPGYLAITHPSDAARTVLETINERPLSTANDLAISSKDAIYLTDSGRLFQPPLTEPTFVHLVPRPGGGAPRHAATAADKVVMPNGIVLSPDERTLYVNDSRSDYMVAWDVQSDGSLTNRRDFAEYVIDEAMREMFSYYADGLAVDSDGRLYSAMPLGVQVFSPEGRHLGTIPVTKKTQNLTFGGPDKRTLYIVSRGSIWKVRTLSQGVTNRAK